MTDDDAVAACDDLIRGLDRAALATALPVDGGGNGGAWPYASLVLVAVDHDLSPILLMSDLAEHTKAIAADAAGLAAVRRHGGPRPAADRAPA